MKTLELFLNKSFSNIFRGSSLFDHLVLKSVHFSFFEATKIDRIDTFKKPVFFADFNNVNLMFVKNEKCEQFFPKRWLSMQNLVWLKLILDVKQQKETEF